MRPRGGDHLKPAQAGGIEEVAEQIATAALRRHITVEGLDDQRLKLRAGAVVPAAEQVAPVQGLRQAKGLGAPALKLGSC